MTSRRKRRAAEGAFARAARTFVLLAVLWASCSAAGAAAAKAEPDRGASWVSVWASVMAEGRPEDSAALAGAGGVTARQLVRVAGEGRRIRLRLSNDHGASPLRLQAVTVAKAAQSGAALAPGATPTPVTASEQRQILIPAGAYVLSDPVDLAVRQGDRLAISIHVQEAPSPVTLHPLALTTNLIAPGDQTASPTLNDATPSTKWLFLSGVEAEQEAGAGGAIVVLGDSLTDGDGAGLDADGRWTDVLARRLRAEGQGSSLSVVNLGLAGGRVMRDGASKSAIARLDRDVFSQAGLQTLIVFMGVNDLGLISREGPVTPQARANAVEGLLAGYDQIIRRARARGVKVIGATLLPFGGTSVYRSDAAADEDRRAVNAWIRQSGGRFDAVLDFDAVTRDPDAPHRLQTRYDRGDHLHLSPLGYRALGEAVPLQLLAADKP